MAPPTLCLSEYNKLTFSDLLIYFSRLREMISRVLVQKSIPDLSRFEQRKTNLEFDLVFTPQNHVFIVENANFTFCKHGQCWSILGMRLKSIAGKLSRLDWMKLNSANNAFALFSKGARHDHNHQRPFQSHVCGLFVSVDVKGDRIVATFWKGQWHHTSPWNIIRQTVHIWRLNRTVWECEMCVFFVFF